MLQLHVILVEIDSHLCWMVSLALMMGCVVTCEQIFGELIKCLFSKNPLENFPPTSGPVNIDSSVLQPFIFQ